MKNILITDFSNYDVVLHVAGIAHVHESKLENGLYDRINRDLVIEVATKAKQEYQIAYCKNDLRTSIMESEKA